MFYTLDPNLSYRMPTHFGPAPGPRRFPDGEPRGGSSLTVRQSIWVTLESSETAISPVLPPGFSVRGVPSLTYQAVSLTKVDWLASRGYSIAEVSRRVAFQGQTSVQIGHFVLVLWEDLADSIITGREELGFAKLFADITAVNTDDQPTKVRSTASWFGFEFLSIAVDNLVPAPLPSQAPPLSRFRYKYLSETGRPGGADCAYPVVTPAADSYAKPTFRARGREKVQVNRATFDQLPTLLHVVNGLADLPMGSVLDAGAQSSVGSKDLSDEHKLR